jgi:p-hydroxybenzoate 3-monooxygenase
VGIVGAGPAGLLLSHLLHLAGVDSVVLEARDRAYVEQRIRAGVLEHPTAELLREVGVGARMDAEGLPHRGLVLRFDGADHRVALSELTGKTITVYGQQEVVKDLIAKRIEDGGQILFESSDVRLHDLTTDQPRITFVDVEGKPQELVCDVIAGCDGFHGVSRQSIPTDKIQIFERLYPFAWLGILAKTPPSHEELIYTYSERGFALHSMRSPELTRLYLQVAPEENLTDWPDDRIWEELGARLSVGGEFALREGPVVDKLLAAMRSFVVEPMRYGRLFLAGDAAHIVPPTGAKGMNLAVADVRLLARALTEFLSSGNTKLADDYSAACLRRVWRAEHFSWWMTSMLHTFPDDDGFGRQLQLSQLRYTASSEAAATSMAENYVGLPYEQ